MKPHVFWFYGLSGAGKTTLADALAFGLRGKTNGVLRLDGDQLRSGLSFELGFQSEDRRENIRRAAEVAKIGLDSSLIVVASFITPEADHRVLVRNIVQSENLTLIHVPTPATVCYERGGYTGNIEGPHDFPTISMESLGEADILAVTKLIDICK